MTTDPAATRPTPASATVLLSIGFTLYVAAWFLQVIRDGATFGSGELPGVQAVRGAWSGNASSATTVLMRLSVLTNLCVAGLAGLLLGHRRAHPEVFVGILAVAFAINLQWVWWSRDDVATLRLGYWAWCLAFAVLSEGVRRGRGN